MSFTAWLTVIGFALSSSIDNFGVGISYGVSKIRIGFAANALISLIAFVFSETGIIAGKYMAKVLPGMMSNIIAAIFLFVISIRILLLTLSIKRDSAKRNEGALSSEGNDTRATETPPVVRKRRRPSMGSKYLTNPEQADLDQSGEISMVEAVVLGVAVSMNALSNGLGAGLLKLSPLAISTTAALFSFLAIWIGCILGNKVANVRIGPWTLGQFSTALSGLILLLIGVHIIFAR
jgi:putative sporulation protein YtaF